MFAAVRTWNWLIKRRVDVSMKDEQAKTLEAVQFAIRMEIDGGKYYEKVSQESNNRVGKDLFQWLAAEEDKHRQRFERIYKSIESSEVWHEIGIQSEKSEGMATLFASAMEAGKPEGKITNTELEAIGSAMDMENKTHDFYAGRGKEAVYENEKKFYEALAAEERGHYLALVDYREYLIDPGGWFSKAEHHSLDGG